VAEGPPRGQGGPEPSDDLRHRPGRSRRALLIILAEGNSARDLRRWLDIQPRGWLEGIGVVATDLAESYRAGLAGRLGRAIRFADPFHLVRVGNRCLDQVRVGSRIRPSATAAASTTRSTGSASSCSPAPNGSTTAATSACCWGFGSGPA
jgi:transposase